LLGVASRSERQGATFVFSEFLRFARRRPT
jgi:hypothetical protein